MCKRLPSNLPPIATAKPEDEIDWDINDKIKAMRERNQDRKMAFAAVVPPSKPKDPEPEEEDDPFGFHR